jgi:hypothetical protein
MRRGSSNSNKNKKNKEAKSNCKDVEKRVNGELRGKR